MKEYKIKVANEAESKEAQELFFELGYEWHYYGKSLQNLDCLALFTLESGILACTDLQEVFDAEIRQEITLPQLRDLVVLHRNDVGDATHKDDNNYMYYENSDGDKFRFYENHWSKLFQHEYRVAFYELKDTQEPQMTWQDALRAVADGKEVEIFIGDQWLPMNKYEHNQFRLAPQRITLDGNFTKEELLKIAGEMA